MSKFDSGERDHAPTRLIRSKNKAATADAPTEHINQGHAGDKETVKIGSEQPTVNINQGQSSAGDAPTVNIKQDNVDFRPETGAMAGGNLNPASDSAAPAGRTSADKTVLVRRSADTAEQATVAWLVIVSGPGKGKSISFSYGLNKIGRDVSQDIALSFGDSEISRQEHASIEFDPKTRKFYLSKGDNLVYLNDERVGAGGEKTLEQGDEIVLGATTLRFVPFCGADFDWPASDS